MRQRSTLVAWFLSCSLLLCTFLAGCSGSEDQDGSGPEPGADNSVVRLLQKPFQGDFINGAPFDHALPLVFQENTNSFMLTWWGGHIEGVWNGHNANDGLLPQNTPLLAAAAGNVVFADFEPPFFCASLGVETSALIVRLQHQAPNGEIFETLYANLNRSDVTVGQRVQAGQQIGVSGLTGCTNGPHLHFAVLRLTHTNNGRPVAIDPFGWQGQGPDPWALHPDGAQSLWLWKQSQAPEGGARLYGAPQ